MTCLPYEPYESYPLKFKLIKPVSNDHGYTINFQLWRLKPPVLQFFALLYRLAGRCSDLTMVNSSWTEEHISTLWGKPESVHKIYPPCDVTEFKLIKRKKQGIFFRLFFNWLSFFQFTKSLERVNGTRVLIIQIIKTAWPFAISIYKLFVNFQIQTAWKRSCLSVSSVLRKITPLRFGRCLHWDKLSPKISGKR